MNVQNGHTFPWLKFNNRPFNNIYELLDVPATKSAFLTRDFSIPQGQLSNPYQQPQQNYEFGHLLNFYYDPQQQPTPPQIAGLYDTETGSQSPTLTKPGTNYTDGSVDRNPDPSGALTAMSWLPTASAHTHHRSAGIPTSFPFQSSTLRVDGGSQISRRGLLDYNSAQGKYPAHVRNIRNAATNLVEIIADAARSDMTGDQPIRIFAIGMGSLVRLPLGTRPETSESVLKRVANDITSPDFNNTQLEGKYYYAATAADVAPAFQQLQAQIVRLSK